MVTCRIDVHRILPFLATPLTIYSKLSRDNPSQDEFPHYLDKFTAFSCHLSQLFLRDSRWHGGEQSLLSPQPSLSIGRVSVDLRLTQEILL